MSKFNKTISAIVASMLLGLTLLASGCASQEDGKAEPCGGGGVPTLPWLKPWWN